ncbi:MAG: T9SS type A sorting domain-containing protein, partial [Rudanella sp.]|nr:T9SS type A sorting domain-containing protein [Rudanella sp.]
NEFINAEFIQNGQPTRLGNELRGSEYDLIVFDYKKTDTQGRTGGGDFIEVNALAVVKLIQELRSRYGNTIQQDFVIIGPSMGSLIAQYALAYMERNGIEHYTRLFISFDGIHQGANIPIGVQQLVNHLGQQGLVSKVFKGIKNGIHNSRAARQMLLHHADSQSESPAPHPWRSVFLQNLSDVGTYPARCRKVAIINGNNQATPNADISQCQNLIDINVWRKDLGRAFCNGQNCLKIDWEASAGVGNGFAGSNPASPGRCESFKAWTRVPLLQLALWRPSEVKSYSRPATDDISYDRVPGSYFGAITEGQSNAMGVIFRTLARIISAREASVSFGSVGRISFVPSTSAADVRRPNSATPPTFRLADVELNRCNLTTPFDRVYASTVSTDHVAINTEIANSFREEVYNNRPRNDCNTPPVNPGSCALIMNACYTIQVQHTSQQLQAMADGTIKQQGTNNQANQIWKIEDRGNGRVSFATQDGTNRSVRAANNASFGDELVLAGYNGDGRQDWTVQCNPADNALWRVVYPNNGNNTWDLKDFGNQPQLQIWGNTSEPFYAYRSFRFNPATCPTATPPPPPPPTGGAFALQTPQYNCQTGQLVMQTSGGNGSTIDYQISGLRGWGTDPTFTVPSWQLQGTAFTLQARQSGNIQTLSFTSSCNGGGTPPPPPPPTGGAFVITDPTFSCASGDLTINTSGGNGSAIEYQISGIRGWGSGATMNIPSWQRNGVAFTLQARQSGTEAPSRPFTASCGGGRLASVIEETVRLSVSPNPSRGLVRVRYWLAARQAGQLRVMSTTGAVLSEQNIVGTGQTEETTLNLDAHPSGLYLINLSGGSVHETAKVLLQR